MSTEISWHVELAVKPGKLEDFRTLTREMVEATRSEPGTLIYERFVSEDGTVVYGYERYVDSAAAVAHLVAFGTTYRDRFMATVERKRFTVFGEYIKKPGSRSLSNLLHLKIWIPVAEGDS